jgi:hypothetical protein
MSQFRFIHENAEEPTMWSLSEDSFVAALRAAQAYARSMGYDDYRLVLASQSNPDVHQVSGAIGGRTVKAAHLTAPEGREC